MEKQKNCRFCPYVAPDPTGKVTLFDEVNGILVPTSNRPTNLQEPEDYSLNSLLDAGIDVNNQSKFESYDSLNQIDSVFFAVSKTVESLNSVSNEN